MRLLDLFCGAGGCGMGYHRAGFEVLGVDNRPQPRYPFEFHQADALEFLAEHGHEFDAIHASPPCQAYVPLAKRSRHPDLVASVRGLLIETGRPYVIENVPTSPIDRTLLLCGSMFGLDVRRHRHFETSGLMLAPRCDHVRQAPRFRTPDRRQKSLSRVVAVYGHSHFAGYGELRKRAMGIDWMIQAELSQAIPPAYTEWIGRHLMRHCRARDRPSATR